MKITDLTMKKEGRNLAFWVTLDDGSQIGAASLWRNTSGLWAADSEAREPAEVAAILRNFARAIEHAAAKDRAA